MKNHPFIVGTIFTVAGAFVCLYGSRMFDEVMTIIAGVVALVASFLLFSVIGLTNSSVGFWICGILSIGLGVGAGWLVWNKKF